jgi:hypothetical protein
MLVTPNVIPSSLILFPLMMEAIFPSEESVHTRITRCNSPEDGILLIGVYSKLHNDTNNTNKGNCDKCIEICINGVCVYA